MSELQETIDEMEVDEQSKVHIFDALSEQTNIRNLLSAQSMNTSHCKKLTTKSESATR